MKSLIADFENWHIEYLPEDGARIGVLKYAGQDLLTAKPLRFRVPDRFCGEYETRPVYGYDDCFPTVERCTYPEANFECRDHGELCWQHWLSEVQVNKLVCSTDCLYPAVSLVLNALLNQYRVHQVIFQNPSGMEFIFPPGQEKQPAGKSSGQFLRVPPLKGARGM